MDAIRAAADLVELSMDRLAASALSISPNIQSAVAQGLLPTLFVDAWAAIMNFDSIGEVVKRLKLQSDGIAPFLQNAARIRYLRNQFQHFPGNMRNRAASKGPRFPQYGVITWTYAPAPEPDPEVFVLCCNLCAHTEQMEMRPVNPAGRVITRPVGCFQLQAYGQVIDYQDIRDALRDLIRFLNSTISENVHKQLQKHASEDEGLLKYLSGNNIGPQGFCFSGFLSSDGQRWIMRGADDKNQPHSGATSVPSS